MGAPVNLLLLGLGLGAILTALAVYVAIRRDDQAMPRLLPPLSHPDGGRRGD